MAEAAQARPTDDGVGPAARWAALAHVLPALAFGISTPIVLRSIRRSGQLPMTPFGFRAFSGPFERLGLGAFPLLGSTLAGACAIDLLAGAMLWQGRRRGARLGLATTPVQLLLSAGFALPFLLAAIPIRLALTALAWPRLR